MSNENYISILGADISYAEERLGTSLLKYYEDNPRVYAKLKSSGPLPDAPEERQNFIYDKMLGEESVKKLITTIKHQGGVTDPLVVLVGTYEVIEGNSRLAALRFLYENEKGADKEKYLRAPCRVLSLSPNQIDAYLHQSHVEGKTEWTPYAQALRPYKRVVSDGENLDDYAKRTRQTKRDVKEQIAIIDLMQNNEGENIRTDRFSYYELLITGRKLKNACHANTGLRDYVLEEIKKDKPAFDAQSLRDGIPQIAKKPKLLKKLMKGKIDFNTAHEMSWISQPKQHISKALENLKAIKDGEISELPHADLQSTNIMFRKCQQEAKRVQGMIQNALDRDSE